MIAIHYTNDVARIATNICHEWSHNAKSFSREHKRSLPVTSLRTEETYIYWTKQFIYFTDKKHPSICGTEEVTAFLTYLALERHVAVNTQKIALNALVFVYRHVLKQDLGDLGFKLAGKQRQLPIVLNPHEIKKILDNLEGRNKLIFEMLYGSGLRVSECLRLRVKDVDTDRLCVTVVDGKGKKSKRHKFTRILSENTMREQ